MAPIVALQPDRELCLQGAKADGGLLAFSEFFSNRALNGRCEGTGGLAKMRETPYNIAATEPEAAGLKVVGLRFRPPPRLAPEA